MATPVIIPCRNEAPTIGAIVQAFNAHDETRGAVFVGMDRATLDGSHVEVAKAGGTPVRTYVHGKGQVVCQTLLAVSAMPGVLNERVILCDGDYTGLTPDHIEALLQAGSPKGMTIGVPDWPDIEVPKRVTDAWPHVSGFRYLPWLAIPSDGHGYLLETQINQMAAFLRLKVKHEFMPGLKSPFQWPLSAHRDAARITDMNWGKEHGIL